MPSDAPLRIALLAYRGKPHVGGQGVYTRHLAKALVDLGHHVEVLGGQPYPILDERVPLIELPSLDIYNDYFPMRMPGLWELKNWTDCRRGHRLLARHLPRAARLLACGPGTTSGTARTTSTSSTTTSASATACSPSSASWASRSSARSTTRSPSTAASRWSTPRAGTSSSRCAAGTPSPTCRREVARRLKRIITVSENSFKDIVARPQGRPRAACTSCPSASTPSCSGRSRGRARSPAASSPPPRADVAMKGLRYLLEAVAKLRTERDDVHLIVIGAASRAAPVDAHHRAPRPRRRTSSSSPACTDERIVELYSEAELAVVPSLYEGFSLPGHRGHVVRRARWWPPPAAPSPRSSAPTATPRCSCRPATARRSPPSIALGARRPRPARPHRRAPAASASSTTGAGATPPRRRSSSTAILARDARARSACSPSTSTGSACSRATCCSTWAAAPAATPSSRSAAAPASSPSTTRPAELKDVGGLFAAMGEAGEAGAEPGHWPPPSTATRTASRSPTTRSTASSPPRCWSTSPTTRRPLAELARVLKPGGTHRRHRARRGSPSRSAGRSPTSTTPRSSRAATSASTPSPSCADRMRAAGLEPGAAHHAHALHSPYWWLKCAVGPTNDDHPLVQGLPPAPVWDIARRSPSARSPAGPRRCSTRCSARASSSTPRKPGRSSASMAHADRRPRRSSPPPSCTPRSTPSPSGSCPSG